MGRHRRREGRTRLRSPLTASLLAVGMVGVIAGVTAIASEATAGGHQAGHSASVAVSSIDASAGPSVSASPSPSPSPTPSPSASDSSSPAPSQTPSAAPTSAQPTSAPAVSLGTTGVAPADQESARVGALFSGSVTAGNHVCTASVIDSPTRNLIVTAAHCVGSADGVSFAPGYRDGKAPYGSWPVAKIYTDANWSSNSDPDVDFAILQLAPSNGRNIEDVVGGNALGLNADFSAQVRLYGYPDTTEQPILCTNATSRQDTYQRRIDCPSYPNGTSGGPWIDTATGKVIGVIGGYQQGGNTDDTSYASYFDHTIGDLYNKAVATSS